MAGRKSMNDKLSVLAMILFTTVSIAEAQQQAKVPRIGWLGAGPGSLPASPSELFWREFRKLGYVEGRNIATEYRYADNKLERLPALADELVRLKVDLLVAGGTNAALAPETLPGQYLSFF
jgi:putative ABC transport system substrate-binding protein